MKASRALTFALLGPLLYGAFLGQSSGVKHLWERDGRYMEFAGPAFIAGLLAGVIYFVPFAAIGFLQEHRPPWLRKRFLSVRRYTSSVMWLSLGYAAACVQYDVKGCLPPGVAIGVCVLSCFYKCVILRRSNRALRGSV